MAARRCPPQVAVTLVVRASGMAHLCQSRPERSHGWALARRARPNYLLSCTQHFDPGEFWFLYLGDAGFLVVDAAGRGADDDDG